MWDLARYELAPTHRLAGIPETIRHQTGLEIVLGPRLFTIRHGVTRFQIELRCYAAASVRGSLRRARGSEWAWVPIESLVELPLNVTARRIVRRLEWQPATAE
jgi:hypothetical protein